MAGVTGPFQATDIPPLGCYTTTTFLHVSNIPSNVPGNISTQVCQTTKLHQHTFFKICGWLPIYYIDFPNSLHLSLTSFCLWYSWSN